MSLPQEHTKFSVQEYLAWESEKMGKYICGG